MRPLLSLIALLSISIIAKAQKNTINQGSVKPNYYEEIPYDDVNGKIFINVEINGTKHRFLFDTGAPVMVTDSLASLFKMPALYQDSVKDVSGYTTITTVVKADIQLGTTTFTGVAALKGLPPGVFSCWPIDGVIGSNLIRNSIVRIDRKKHLIIITDQKNKLSFNNANSTKLYGNIEQSDPMVALLVGNKINLVIGFDTGDSGFLRLTEEMTDKLQKVNVFDTIGKGYGANSYGALGLQKQAEKFRIKFPFLNIGQTKFINVITETNKSGIPGFGTELLKYGVVTLDFIHHKFYFDADSLVINMNAKQWPIAPAFVDGKLVVGVIWDKGVGKVLPGEQIVAINGKDRSHPDFCELINMPSDLTGRETAVLTIKDKDGKLRDVEIKKE